MYLALISIFSAWLVHPRLLIFFMRLCFCLPDCSKTHNVQKLLKPAVLNDCSSFVFWRLDFYPWHCPAAPCSLMCGRARWIAGECALWSSSHCRWSQIRCCPQSALLQRSPCSLAWSVFCPNPILDQSSSSFFFQERWNISFLRYKQQRTVCESIVAEKPLTAHTTLQCNNRYKQTKYCPFSIPVKEMFR